MPDVQPTNNPVPSDNPADARDNFKRIDEVVNSTENLTSPTRTGVQLVTLHRYNELVQPNIDGARESAAEAAASAAAAEAAVSGLDYQGLWPDSGGSANKGDTYQTQVSGTPTGQYFTALQNTTVDPASDNANWRGVISNQSLGGVTNYQASSVDDMIQGLTTSQNQITLKMGQFWSSGSTPWRVESETAPIDDNNFVALGAVVPYDFGGPEDPQSIQKAINTGYDVYIPRGIWLYDNINLNAGQKLIGAGRGLSILRAASTSSLVDIGGFKHNVSILDIGFDGGSTTEKCISLRDTFRTCIQRVNIYNYTNIGLEMLNNTYFSSFRDIHIDFIGTGISIQPDIDYALEHAASNANLYENIAINHFTTRGIDMKNAAGNTFNVINYEQAENSVVECLRIDHCTNNKFLTNWFEPGNPTGMTRIIYINDNFNRFYTRNNEFDNCYIIGGATEQPLYHILTGSCLRNTVKNTTFLRSRICLQNGGDSKYFRLDKSNTYNLFDGTSKILSGTSDRQIVHTKHGTATLNAANNTVTIPFELEGTDLQYDGASIKMDVSSFSGVSEQSNLSLYSFKFSDRVEVFHQGAAISGSTTIDFDYVLTYYAEV